MNEWVTIGSLNQIPLRGARVVRTPSGDIALFRTADDKLFALHDHCPHKGGPLSEGMVYGERVACPLHNWSIDLASGEAVAPDSGCARTYRVRCVGDQVQLWFAPRGGCAHGGDPGSDAGGGTAETTHG